MIQTTSQLSFLDTLFENKIGLRQKQVLDALRSAAYLNNRQIAELTGLPVNVVTPRCQELRKAGHVVEHARAKDSATNRLTIFWRLA